MAEENLRGTGASGDSPSEDIHRVTMLKGLFTKLDRLHQREFMEWAQQILEQPAESPAQVACSPDENAGLRQQAEQRQEDYDEELAQLADVREENVILSQQLSCGRSEDIKSNDTEKLKAVRSQGEEGPDTSSAVDQKLKNIRKELQNAKKENVEMQSIIEQTEKRLSVSEARRRELDLAVEDKRNKIHVMTSILITVNDDLSYQLEELRRDREHVEGETQLLADAFQENARLRQQIQRAIGLCELVQRRIRTCLGRHLPDAEQPSYIS